MPGTLTSAAGKISRKLKSKKIAVVVAEWNADITDALFHGAFDALLKLGAQKKNISRLNVPGSFELPLAAKHAAGKKNTDAVICIGCIIQGDTPHFDYICQAVAQGLMKVGLDSGKPVAFGVLTTLNRQQALDRSGGIHGNKGEEAAVTAVKMLELINK